MSVRELLGVQTTQLKLTGILQLGQVGFFIDKIISAENSSYVVCGKSFKAVTKFTNQSGTVELPVQSNT